MKFRKKPVIMVWQAVAVAARTTFATDAIECWISLKTRTMCVLTAIRLMLGATSVSLDCPNPTHPVPGGCER